MKNQTFKRTSRGTICCLLLLSVSVCRAQETLPQKDIDSIFLKALLERIDWVLSSGYKYVDLEGQANVPRKIFEKGPIKVLPQTDIIEISRKEGKELTVYILRYQVPGKDTVDVNFGEYYLKGLKPKGKTSPLAEISLCKCATFEPDIRFVRIDDKWRIISSTFISNER